MTMAKRKKKPMAQNKQPQNWRYFSSTPQTINSNSVRPSGTNFLKKEIELKKSLSSVTGPGASNSTNKIDEGNPSTSRAAAAAQGFKKFMNRPEGITKRIRLNKRKRTILKKQMNNVSGILNSSQILTRKLVNLARRQHLDKASTPKNIASFSMEEGKIRSDVEGEDKSLANAVDEDDCMLVEPVIETIVIDDSKAVFDYKNILAQGEKQGTMSTPRTEGNPVVVPSPQFSMFYNNISGMTNVTSSLWQRNSPIYSIRSNNLNSSLISQCRPSNNEVDSVRNELVINLDDDDSSDCMIVSEPMTDNSVVFVKEIRTDDFIPLNSNNVPNRLPATTSVSVPPQAAAQMEINVLPTRKRMVFIDGSNVAFHHSRNKEFSVKGLKICLQYFEALGHKVCVVVPQYRINTTKSTDPTEMRKLLDEHKIILTPCKNHAGRVCSSYDDRILLQLAVTNDGVVVSNDNFRDLRNENADFEKVIDYRVIGFTFFGDQIYVPLDPYGPHGPSLSSILNY